MLFKFLIGHSLVLVGILLSACSPSPSVVTFKNQSGDLVQFVDQEFRKYGGTPGTNGPRPVLQTEWQFAEDRAGFQILISHDKRAALVQALTNSLGLPLLQGKYPQLVYKEDRFGVGMIADLNGDPIQIICIRKGVL